MKHIDKILQQRMLIHELNELRATLKPISSFTTVKHWLFYNTLYASEFNRIVNLLEKLA